MMKKDNNRGTAIIDVLKSDSVKGLSAEYLEQGIDAFLDSGVLKDIPLVSSILGVVNTVGTIKDHIFISKLIRFFNNLADIPKRERMDMVDRLNEDKNFSGKAGSAIIEILDRMESEIKPELSANFFSAYARKQISFIELRRVLLALERVPSFDIDKLDCFSKNKLVGSLEINSVLLAFVSAGLGVNNGGLDGGSIIPTELCLCFVRHMGGPV